MRVRAPRHSFSVLAVLLSLLGLPALGADEPAVALFNELCAACHTVGGGDGAGPDLLPSTGLPRPVVRLSVERMQDNTGPMTAEQIDALTDLLLDPAVKTKLAGEAEPAAEAEPEVPPGSPEIGLRLFFGQERFANRGSACFACHSVAGRGGNLAADLSLIGSRMTDRVLATTMEKPAYPLMKVEYGKHPLTADEARHVAAFLTQSAAATAAQLGPTDRPAVLYGTAAGFALLLFGGAAFVSRARRGPSRHHSRSTGGQA
jgi:mono/diheme cytochrome c family protein